jgi:hypothetical protein
VERKSGAGGIGTGGSFVHAPSGRCKRVFRMKAQAMTAEIVANHFSIGRFRATLKFEINEHAGPL